MRKTTGIIVKHFWGLCAVLLISLAVLVTIGRELAPQLTHYRTDIEAALSEAMDVRVTIGSIAATWEGLSPELQILGVEVTSLDGKQILAVDTAFAELNLLRSLFNWELVLGRVEFVDIAMEFEQQANGIWTLPGLSPNISSDIKDPLDIFLLSERIEFSDARFSFDFRSGHNSQVELPHLVLENSGRFHRLRSELAVDRNRDVVSLIIEAQGDPRELDSFTARGHLRLQRFELDKALAALPGQWWDGLPEQEWRKGHQLDLELWFDVAKHMVIDAHGHLDIGELPVSLADNVPAMPKRTSANFAGRWAKDGAWKLAFRDLSLEWEEAQAPVLDLLLSSANLGEAVHLQTEELDLARWSATIRSAGLVKGGALEALEMLQPEGLLRYPKLSIAGTGLEDLTLRANLHKVAFGSWKGAPAMERVDGYLEASPLGGFVDLASDQGLSMHYPTLFHDPLEFDTARGRVRWQIDPERRTVDVHSGLLSVNSEMGEGRGYFSLFVPFELGSQQEELVVQVGLRNSEARYHQQLTPYVLPEPLRNWLDQSVGAGEVSSGGFVYRGGITRSSAEQAAVQLFLNVEDAELAYHPDWPPLKQASGVVWLNDRTISAELDSGRVFDTELRGGSISVEAQTADKGLQLNIKGLAQGNASDGLRFIRETPIREVVGSSSFAEWTLEGEMQTAVELTTSLQAGRTPLIQQLEVDFQDARLTTGALDLQFEAIEGRISYNDQDGLRAEGLNGRLWGNTVNAELGQIDSTDQSGRAFALNLAGSASIKSLRGWSKRPELGFFQGASDFHAELIVPYGQAINNGQQNELARLRVQTDLQGVAIDLPQPLGKAADERRLLTISAPLSAGENHYRLRYGDTLDGALAVSDGKLVRIGLSLGGEAGLPEQPGLELTGHIDQFKFSEWQTALERYQQTEGPTSTGKQLKRSLDLQFGTFVLDEFEIKQLHLTAEEAPGHWQLGLGSALVAGQARLYKDDSQPILLDLEHLRLPGSEPEPPDVFDLFLPPPEPRALDFLAELNPASLPAVDFVVEDFSVGDEAYGSWSFQLRPTESGLVARKILGVIRGGQVIGLEPGKGAELFWDITEGEVNSRFNGRFVSDNLGGVLEQWNQPHLLDSESSRFDVRLSWPGSPAAISLTALQGDMVMAVRDGTFIRGAGEASTGSALLELIAFFNFDTWLRRLRLDFSDLSGAGTNFKSMDGVLRFDQGKVYMDTPVVVNSLSSRFQMAGVVDLVDSSLDTKLVATIPVGGNLTFVAALAGMGLPAVAGMWLISKVFEEQIGKMSSLSFQVTGPLDDPKMDFVRLFDDQAVQGDVGSR